MPSDSKLLSDPEGKVHLNETPRPSSPYITLLLPIGNVKYCESHKNPAELSRLLKLKAKL